MVKVPSNELASSLVVERTDRRNGLDTSPHERSGAEDAAWGLSVLVSTPRKTRQHFTTPSLSWLRSDTVSESHSKRFFLQVGISAGTLIASGAMPLRICSSVHSR